ncbi:hypothetical protein QYQ99_25535 [Comamonas testosteroni]|uniref:hypothetical protein n=1 Tax=Comamonas testosteroni TaxID=285 RepID=UPI00265ED7AB|nr:hypothetical protein [Comamonas testosteroni]WKL15652.1 hypothetical protein QYQ99_25535 [Comamonas testosteroni]
MQPTWPPATEADVNWNEGRVSGWRAVIEFAPKPTSSEKLCAGVVVRTEDGYVQAICAIDERKAEHAFGVAGQALHTVAQHLCNSLLEHWKHQPAETWTPPFSNARIENLSRFSAASADEALELMLRRCSTVHTLLNAYVITQQQRNHGIVSRVKSAIQRDTNAKHLAKRFNKKLTLGGETHPLQVDFLGQNYACYFLQVTSNVRGLEGNTERAYGKLFELSALKRILKKPSKKIGLLEDEKPEIFELLMVGDRNDPIQKRAINQVLALADGQKIVARTEPNPMAAAERVSSKERRVA